TVCEIPRMPDTAQNTTQTRIAPRATITRGVHDDRRQRTARTAPHEVSSQLTSGCGATASCNDSGAVSRIPATPAIAMRRPVASAGGLSSGQITERDAGMEWLYAGRARRSSAVTHSKPTPRVRNRRPDREAIPRDYDVPPCGQ